jgi:hypothetical protein
MYSEQKEGYLLNAGYMLEQMDLYLSARSIGVCWYGLAKTEQKTCGELEFVIMLSFGKCRTEDFRQGAQEFNRKQLQEIWEGDFDEEVKNAVRLSPSACNSQSWRFRSCPGLIEVYRTKNIKTFIPLSMRGFFNTIDIGISLCFLEIALVHKNYKFERNLATENCGDLDIIKIATYKVE